MDAGRVVGHAILAKNSLVTGGMAMVALRT